jgi:hypothetical protein
MAAKAAIHDKVVVHLIAAQHHDQASTIDLHRWHDPHRSRVGRLAWT